jgi:hypothetical protein
MSASDRYADYLEHGSADDDTMSPGARAELDALREQLGAAATWAEPPGGLRDAVVDQITALRDETSSATTAPMRPARNPWRVRLLAAAAVVAVIVAAAVVVATRGDDQSTRFALSGTPLAPGATGSVVVDETGSGVSISLTIDHLRPARPGTYYQAWVKGPSGTVPIGTFHAREADGPIELWSGVDRSKYPTMTVTLQTEGAGPASSGRVVLRGNLEP